MEIKPNEVYMTCRRGCGSSYRYTDSEREIHKYVGAPCTIDGCTYYPADQVNAGVAMLIGMLKNANQKTL